MYAKAILVALLSLSLSASAVPAKSSNSKAADTCDVSSIFYFVSAAVIPTLIGITRRS